MSGERPTPIPDEVQLEKIDNTIARIDGIAEAFASRDFSEYPHLDFTHTEGYERLIREQQLDTATYTLQNRSLPYLRDKREVLILGQSEAPAHFERTSDEPPTIRQEREVLAIHSDQKDPDTAVVLTDSNTQTLENTAIIEATPLSPMERKILDFMRKNVSASTDEIITHVWGEGLPKHVGQNRLSVSFAGLRSKLPALYRTTIVLVSQKYHYVSVEVAEALKKPSPKKTAQLAKTSTPKHPSQLPNLGFAEPPTVTFSDSNTIAPQKDSSSRTLDHISPHDLPDSPSSNLPASPLTEASPNLSDIDSEITPKSIKILESEATSQPVIEIDALNITDPKIRELIALVINKPGILQDELLDVLFPTIQPERRFSSLIQLVPEVRRALQENNITAVTLIRQKTSDKQDSPFCFDFGPMPKKVPSPVSPTATVSQRNISSRSSSHLRTQPPPPASSSPRPVTVYASPRSETLSRNPNVPREKNETPLEPGASVTIEQTSPPDTLRPEIRSVVQETVTHIVLSQLSRELTNDRTDHERNPEKKAKAPANGAIGTLDRDLVRIVQNLQDRRRPDALFMRKTLDPQREVFTVLVNHLKTITSQDPRSLRGTNKRLYSLTEELRREGKDIHEVIGLLEAHFFPTTK
jgi:hypothetical protein